MKAKQRKAKVVQKKKYRFDLFRRAAELVASFDRATDRRTPVDIRVTDISTNSLYDLLLSVYNKGLRDGRKKSK